MHDAIDVQVLAAGLQFPEGPVALNDGSVLVAEIRSGLIKRVWPDGTVTTHADCSGRQRPRATYARPSPRRRPPSTSSVSSRRSWPGMAGATDR